MLDFVKGWSKVVRLLSGQSGAARPWASRLANRRAVNSGTGPLEAQVLGGPPTRNWFLPGPELGSAAGGQ